MPIHLDCPICDQRLKVSNKAAGRVVKCRACGNAVRVPEPKSMLAAETASKQAFATEPENYWTLLQEFVAARPGAALVVVLILIVSAVGIKIAARAASNSNWRFASSTAARKDGPVDPEAWEGVVESDSSDRVRVTEKSATGVQISVVPAGSKFTRKTLKVFLKIVLKIENLSPSETLGYTGWSAALGGKNQTATLKDDMGAEYPQLDLGERIAGQLGNTSIQPGGSVDDVLVFDNPKTYVKYLKLALPAQAVGGTGILRIKIPQTPSAD
jgi:hypothetical protein